MTTKLLHKNFKCSLSEYVILKKSCQLKIVGAVSIKSTRFSFFITKKKGLKS